MFHDAAFKGKGISKKGQRFILELIPRIDPDEAIAV
jgi:hypothetical protein